MTLPATVSALVVTRGRKDWLIRCVDSLVEANRRDPVGLRVTILVNGPDAASREASRRLREKYGELDVDLIFLDQAETPAQARNLALKRIDSPWILFVDDDAFVNEEFFTQFRNATVRRPDASVIGGPNLTPPGASAFQVAVGKVLASRFGSFGSYSRYHASGEIRRGSERDLILCNLFVRGDALQHKNFPRDFQCAEENWLLQDISIAGGELVYDPSLVVWHERREGFLELGRQVLKYGHGRGQNIFRRPSSTRLFHLAPSLALLAGIGFLITSMASRSVHPVFGALVVVYLFLTWVASWPGEFSPKAWLLRVVLFPLIHVTYGVGVLKGIFHEFCGWMIGRPRGK